MSKLKGLTVTYGRKQSTGNYSNVDIVATATVEPDSGESDAVAMLKAMAYCRNHVMLELSGPFPTLKQKIDGLPLDLEAVEAMQTIANLPEAVQQALVESGIDPDRFIYSLLPENVEAAFKQ